MYTRLCFVAAVTGLAYFSADCAGEEPATQLRMVTLAVLDLEAKGVSKVEASSLSDVLRANIASFKRFTVLERSQMQEILKEQGFQQSGACADDACVVEVGQLLGALRLVAGSVGKVGKTYVVTVRTLDVATGEVLQSESEKIKGEIDEILEMAIPVVAARLCGYSDTEIEKLVKERGLKDLFVRGASRRLRILRSSLFVSGVAAAVVGGIVLGRSNGYYHDYENEVEPRRVEELRGDVERQDRWSYVLLGVGGALVIGGGVTFAF